MTKWSKVSLWKVIHYGIKFNTEYFPFTFLGVNIVSLLFGIFQGFSTFITQCFFESVEGAIAQNNSIGWTYLMLTALGMTLVANSLLGGLNNFLNYVMNGKTDGIMNQIIHKKIARINPVCLEDTKFHDDMEKANIAAGSVINFVNKGFFVLTFYLSYFLFMGFYLHHLKPQFVFAIVLVFVPVLLTQFVRTCIIAKFQDKAAPINRESNHYYWVVAGGVYLKETRILGAYAYFFNKMKQTLKKLGKAEWDATAKINLLELCTGFISAGGYGLIILMLVNALLADEITVGAFSAVFTSIGMLHSLMQEMINKQIGQMAADLGEANNFIRFIELPERNGVPEKPAYEKGIVIENVSFVYPHCENKSLDDVSLEIKDGETIAIVGENGAGKTTLIRLLMGIYTPTEGRVLIHGMDTLKTDVKSIFSGQSGVFQKYQRYQMTLKENVQISANGNGGDLKKALERAGLDDKGACFPLGDETMLSREFGGVELSGGEWQRIAIARGLYRNHHMVVLDEPTAAIDPIEESRIYNQFIELSKGKTAVIVTHRLGSVKIADKIVVMDKGKIADVGSHNELMKRSGLYTEMYNSQSAWYQ
jgi:ATP-binding cassette subfamily B protein